MTLTIGTVEMAHTAVLAPMSGVTDLPFRRAVRRAAFPPLRIRTPDAFSSRIGICHTAATHRASEYKEPRASPRWPTEEPHASRPRMRRPAHPGIRVFFVHPAPECTGPRIPQFTRLCPSGGGMRGFGMRSPVRRRGSNGGSARRSPPHSRPGDAEVAARRGGVLRRPWEFFLETWRPERSRAVAAIPNSVYPTVTNNGFNRSTENA